MFIYYDESILTYVSSIRKYFGLSSSYEDNLKFTNHINSLNPKKIFLVVIDGMGANLIEKKLSEDSFLRKNMFKKVQTVFPPTTTAALTSISNGKSPNENAWLGWQEYIKEVDDVVIPFLGKAYRSDKDYGYNLVYDLVPYKTTVQELNELGIKSYELYPDFRKDGCKDFEEFSKRLTDLSYGDNRYVFAYWDKYDTVMHYNGPDSSDSNSYLMYINDKLEEVANNLNDDTMMVIVADHGQVNVKEPFYIKGSKYEVFMDGMPSIETRSPGFYIKDEYKEVFEKEFKEDFENDFILLNKEEIIETKLFGYHENHPRFKELLPDYIAIGKSNMVIAWDENEALLKGQHAGIDEDEIFIPVITYMK